MPFDTIYVDRVDETETRLPGVRRFVITGHHYHGQLGGFQASTTSQWAASMCQRAQETGRAVAVAWQGVGPWQNIVSVDFAEEATI